jgi:hypothetical protein
LKLSKKNVKTAKENTDTSSHKNKHKIAN